MNKWQYWNVKNGKVCCTCVCVTLYGLQLNLVSTQPYLMFVTLRYAYQSFT